MAGLTSLRRYSEQKFLSRRWQVTTTRSYFFLQKGQSLASVSPVRFFFVVVCLFFVSHIGQL